MARAVPRWLALTPHAAAPLRRLAGLDATVRAPDGLPDALGRIGDLEIRLARTRRDIRRAQRLRYQVFHSERGARRTPRALLSRRDVDHYDRHCDHLLVVDHAYRRDGRGRAWPRVVGCYRVLRQDAAERGDGFYSTQEFDLRGLFRAHPGARFLELGRACVLAPYRTRKTIDLLWQGLWRYIRHHQIDVMFGCASLDGADPQALADQLSFLHHKAAAPAQWAATALPARYVAMNRCVGDAIDAKAAFAALPPLLKAYLRLGAVCGDGAVVDHAFGVTDVLVVMKVADISARHVRFYESKARAREG
jgi:putative hemolysin